MKNITEFITEAGTTFRLVNWPSTRFSWISDMIASYIKDNNNSQVNSCLNYTKEYCKKLSNGFGVTTRINPNKITDIEIKTIYDLCKLESKKDGLTKPKQTKLKKTMSDIESYFNWKKINMEDIDSYITSPDKIDLLGKSVAYSKRDKG